MTDDQLADLERRVFMAAAVNHPVRLSVAEAAWLVLKARGELPAAEPATQPEAPAGKPQAAPAPPRAAQPGGREPWTTRILRRIGEAGPQRVGELAAHFGVEQGVFFTQVKASPWFAKTDPANRLSPLGLTDAGRAALAELPAATASGS